MSDPGQQAAAQDVVAVFDDAGNQLFADARSVRAVINERAKPATHPVETGGTIGDNVVDLPTTIELSVILRPGGFRDTYQQIKAAYKARNLLSVQTKTDTYDNMLLHDFPHDETPEMFNTVAVGIKLTEFILVEPQYAQLPATQVKKKANASTVQTGQQNPTPATTKQQSAAFSLIFGSH